MQLAVGALKEELRHSLLSKSTQCLYRHEGFAMGQVDLGGTSGVGEGLHTPRGLNSLYTLVILNHNELRTLRCQCSLLYSRLMEALDQFDLQAPVGSPTRESWLKALQEQNLEPYLFVSISALRLSNLKFDCKIHNYYVQYCRIQNSAAGAQSAPPFEGVQASYERFLAGLGVRVRKTLEIIPNVETFIQITQDSTPT